MAQRATDWKGRLGNLIGWAILLGILGTLGYYGWLFWKEYHRGYDIGYKSGRNFVLSNRDKHAMVFAEAFKTFVEINENKMHTETYAKQMYREGWDAGCRDGIMTVPH